MFSDFISNSSFLSMFTPERITQIIRVLLIVVIGFPAIKISTNVLSNLLKKTMNPQVVDIFKKAIYYFLLIILVVTVLNQLGFKLSALLGAAGIFGVAIGFASQTSFSSLISGIFLMSEKSFSVGDSIQIGSELGQVLSIDLLSVKLRTFDNRLIRIPNELMLKSQVIVNTKFPIRRLDFVVGVAYGEDLNNVLSVLRSIIKDNVFAFNEPAPLLNIGNFEDSGIEIKLGVWTRRQDLFNMANSLKIEIHNKFKEHNIEIPFPYRNLVFTNPVDVNVKQTL